MIKYILKVVIYVAVVLGIAFGGAYCFSLEPRKILVGNSTATYYTETGSLQGRTKQTGNKIEIYDRNGAYDGRITLDGGTIRFYDRAGAQSGRATVSGSKISIYNRSGAFEGSIIKGSTSRFYDARGAVNGWATGTNTTIFYNSNGQNVGKKQ